MPLLELHAIGKSFAGNRVLADVSLTLNAGETHILAGENGAGKSTLIKILAGVHSEYDGEVLLDGKRVRFRSARDAADHGVSVIHQEMSLIDSMSVIDNIFLGREKTQGSIWLDRSAQLRHARRLCVDLGLDIDLSRAAGEFPVSVKSRVEIVKALTFDSRLIVMDEPSAALPSAEVERLFGVIARLKERGCGIIYISHRMEEIYRIADRITVLRDGRRIGTAPAAELPEKELIRWMIGRELGEQFPAREFRPGPARLRVAGFRVPNRAAGRRWAVEDVGFEVRAGEILGIAGLQGSGSAELLSALFGGAEQRCEGECQLDGERFRPRSARESIARGLVHLTADRKGTGLVLGFGIRENVSLASLGKHSRGGWLSRASEARAAGERVRGLRIRCTSAEQETGTLSGGNQQKVVIAKWLETAPKVLLLEEPTRGVDVGAKKEIYELIHRCTAEGMAVVLVSTDMPELIGLSDRVAVLHRGRLSAEFARGQATPERILSAAMGATQGESVA